MRKRNKNWIILSAFTAMTMTFIFGCGKQGFVASTSTISQQSPGNFIIPPKVDILLAEDDTGSIKEAYTTIAQQFPQFLSQLQSKNWDYHFATIPLTTDRSIDQVIASQFDSNWGSLWQPPFPGAPAGGPGTVDPSVFRMPGQYSGFLTYDDTSNRGGGQEPGLDNLTFALKNRTGGTNFLRDDALLVVLVVGNGQDTSKVNYCTRPQDGIRIPCEDAGQPQCTDISQAGAPGATCGSKALSYNYYRSQLQSLKPSTAQLKFYAAVSTSGSSYCLGSRAYAGTRYMQMALDNGGRSFDLCSQNVTGVLNSLAENLYETRLAMQTRYLFIDQEPDVSTLQVTKYLSGDGNQAVSIPQDPENGWTYAGYLSNVYAIDAPINLNLSSGYAIELHGTAKLLGDDTASVNFLPKGLQNSAR